MRSLILAVVLCSLGCSKPQTPPSKADAVVAEKAQPEPTESIEQKLVRERLEKEHTGDPINWLQWWPTVDTEKAGLRTYYAERDKWRNRNVVPGTVGGGEDLDLRDEWELLDWAMGPTKKKPDKVLPDRMLRVRYRVADKLGKPVLHDEVCFFRKDGTRHDKRLVQDKDAAFRDFAVKVFP